MKPPSTEVVLGLFAWCGLAAVVAFYAASGCEKKGERPIPPPPTTRAAIGTLDGAMEWQFENHAIAGKDGVYIMGPGGVWLLRNDQAVKVREVPQFDSAR